MSSTESFIASPLRVEPREAPSSRSPTRRTPWRRFAAWQGSLNGLFCVRKRIFGRGFMLRVRRQLDPIWHTIGRKTKQLVSDLRTLRKLLDYLVRYDAVTYLKYLDTLRVSEGVRSVWMFAESSHKIFELAKRRVYQVVRADGTRIASVAKNKKKRKMNDKSKKEKESENGVSSSNLLDPTVGVVLDEVLEEAPKWKVLRELLEEIEEERHKEALSRQEQNMVENVEDNTDIVLVACKDELSCLQLEDCISKGPHKVMREEWEKYLLGKAELHSLRKRNKKRSQDPKGFGVLDGVATGPSENTEASSISKLENDALLAAASEISNLNKEEISVGHNSEPRTRRGNYGRGRGRGKSRNLTPSARVSENQRDKLSEKENNKIDQGRGRGRGKSRESTERAQVAEKRSEKPSEKENNKIDQDGMETEGQHGEADIRLGGSLEEATLANASDGKIVLQRNEPESSATESSDTKPLPPVQFYALERDQHILGLWKPSVIIVYHPDMSFVREIEVYKAENPSKKLKVYFLFYEDSTEVQKFEASIRRENGAFESLIRQKSLMMIPVDQDGRCVGPTICEPQSLTSQNSLTRKAGGRKTVEKEMQVIVDMREFMSSLPNVLHQKGMRVIPITLEVGDYVLSPLICVERKSIGDLFQSFASGRLYHQAEMMNRYYKIPVLLIEFSQDRSFSFQSANDIGDDVTPTSIISKLSLLVLHFPRLRLVWSRSLHATAEIFASLKANQDEPDESKAIRVGVPSEDGIVENDVRAENYNTSAIEFLRRLPGVTDSNYRAIMDSCKNLAELALLPVERLAELMGGQKAAKTLKEFLDAKCPTML
ncbi:uncharacterized protein A4U43_C04F31370 [Asparagus officinalis]|uniref:ERCC4 domain-containing protein n=1 Tax=Asparagus officinalis TaxID=4686 RepID=A0A5P1F4X3_ASPOF|nr:uncharacterized protein A4U43_C04F31370 [Asparagus officinalis]